MRITEFPTTGNPVLLLFGFLRRQSYGPNLEQNSQVDNGRPTFRAIH
jgi:hypothetical protein